MADNYNPYMSVGRDAGSSGQLTISNGGKLLMTGNALTFMMRGNAPEHGRLPH